MRNLLWRCIAVALAGCVGWLLWHWPAPVEPVEFSLEVPCDAGFFPLEDGSFECWKDGVRVHYVPYANQVYIE